MITNTDHLNAVKKLCREVDRLASEVTKANDKAARLDADGKCQAAWQERPGPKLTGELRRRSMDLTRALAELRKS